ncbi:MAG: porin [Betaproteobacteria bacterium]
MKKSLIALALMGAFSGAAFAQSNVTLYGILDVNYMWQEGPTNVGTTAAPRIDQESVNSINSGHQSGNRWGLRGTESLGGGMSAIFALESGFDLDRGTSGQSNRLFGRQAYVGLSSGYGTLVAGRLATFSSGTGDFDMIGRIDPFLTGFGLAGAQNTFISMNATRVDNAIAYVTPTFSGFKAGIGYSTGINGAEVAPSSNNVRATIAGANWTYGPFFAAITYDVVNNVGSAPDQKHLQIGGTWDVGPVRLHAGWADQSDIATLVTSTGGTNSFLTLPTGLQGFDATSWLLGATWTVTPAFKVFGSYQQFDADSKAIPNTTRNFEPDYNVWGFGATYNLSRRTNLYASWASRDSDGTLVGNAADSSQLAIGVRHLF